VVELETGARLGVSLHHGNQEDTQTIVKSVAEAFDQVSQASGSAGKWPRSARRVSCGPPRNRRRTQPGWRQRLEVDGVNLLQAAPTDSREELCMVFLLIEVPQEMQMACQHTQRNQFREVDNLFGARQMAHRLNLELEYCVGAGDTEMDTFLQGVGKAVEAGPSAHPFRGFVQTIKLPDSLAFRDLLFRLAGAFSAKERP
jgi:hypothetical protein